MIVRELITRLGYEIDEASFRKAQQRYDAMAGAAAGGSSSSGKRGGAGVEAKKAGDEASKAAEKAKKSGEELNATWKQFRDTLAGLGIGAMLHQYVELASNANETTNALKELFGPEGQADVIAWSKDMAAAMGRSQYDLQSYASRLGSVIGPVAKSKKEAQDMSLALSGLAVDLASFFNTTDEDAMLALRSELTGEYESLKRYGVVINDATLAEIAHTKGIKKKVSAMTVAEKTELRYAAIMERTKTAQGDAARTGAGFANASKALKAQIRDLGTNMAMTVIPALEKLVAWGRDAITWFNQMTRDTKTLQAAFIVLGAAALYLASSTALAFVQPLLIIGLLVLAVDELINLFTGGRTVIGDFIDETFGIGTTDKLVTGLSDSFDTLIGKINESWAAWQDTWSNIGDMQGLWDMFAERITGFGEDIGIIMAGIAADIFKWLTKPFADAYNALARTSIGKKLGLEEIAISGDYERARTRGLDADAMGEGEFRGYRRREREANRKGRVAARAERHRQYIEDAALAGLAEGDEGIPAVAGTAYTLRRRQARKDRLAREAAEAEADALQSHDPGLSAAPGALEPGPMSSLDSGESAMSSMPANVTNNTTFNVTTNDPAVVARVVNDTLDKRNKRTAATVGKRGQT